MKNKKRIIVDCLSVVLTPLLLNCSVMAMEGKPTLVIDSIYWDNKLECLSHFQVPKNIPADALPMYLPTDSYCDNDLGTFQNEPAYPKGKFEDVSLRQQMMTI